MRFRRILKWNDRSEIWKTAFALSIVILVTISGYTTFVLVMGTTSPLVVVTSGSMEPTLYRGDLLVIQARAEDQIAIDDVIVFQADWNPDMPIVHRVIRISEDEYGNLLFATRGDNNHAVDYGNRTIDDIIGVVVGIIPVLGHVSLFLQTTEGQITAVILILVILLVPEVLERRRNADEE